jgi:hypothetical protein
MKVMHTMLKPHESTLLKEDAMKTSERSKCHARYHHAHKTPFMIVCRHENMHPNAIAMHENASLYIQTAFILCSCNNVLDMLLLDLHHL